MYDLDGEPDDMDETPAQAAPPRLPAPLDSLNTGLDLNQLDASTKGLGIRLAGLVGEHVLTVRTERQAGRDDSDAAYAVAEVAPLVRDLAHAGDVLRRIGREFVDAAKSVDEFIVDEALSTGRDRVAVPDGDSEIVVAPKVEASTWAKPDQLGDVIATLRARECNPDLYLEAAVGDVYSAIVRAYEDGVRAGFAEVERYGKVGWRITDTSKLAAALMARAEDELAARVERSMGRQTTATGDLTVKREAFKTGRRR